MSSPWQCLAVPPSEAGESPFWHPGEQQLYWIDIAGRSIQRCNVFMGTVEHWALPQEPGCIAPAASGGLVVALRDGIYRARSWGGPLLPLVRFNHDSRVIRFNDGKADPLGRFWAGTMYEPRDQRKGELYCVDCRPDNGNGGRPLVELKAHNVVTANGLAWAPDARTVYWADTREHRVQAWDWDGPSNVMRHHRVLHQFPPKPAGWQPGQPGYGGRPDGAAVDCEGNYWVAMFEGGRLAKLSPRGELLAEVATPTPCPTMPCFGGDDLRTLYLTSLRHGRSADELARHPDSGGVFALRVDTPGLPVHFFVD